MERVVSSPSRQGERCALTVIRQLWTHGRRYRPCASASCRSWMGRWTTPCIDDLARKKAGQVTEARPFQSARHFRQ
eukprot:scaffold1307_cov200-Pinguiococcus_pyrenoidosus.AAC.36